MSADSERGQQEMRDWLDGLTPEKREWAIVCMTSAGAGGIGFLDLDNPTYGALLHARIPTVALLKQRIRNGYDLDGIPGIGPRRVQRIQRSLEAYDAQQDVAKWLPVSIRVTPAPAAHAAGVGHSEDRTDG